MYGLSYYPQLNLLCSHYRPQDAYRWDLWQLWINSSINQDNGFSELLWIQTP